MIRFFATIIVTAAILTSAPPVESNDAAKDGHRITGPYVCKNLSVFLFHGGDLTVGDNILTLEEALASGAVIVHETGSVGQLQIENLSEWDVFIQAGDIVKGGRQDRFLRYDLIIKAHSGKMPLPSFCVEQGRWSQRDGEEATRFGSSNNMAASRELKLAAKLAGSQKEVWSEVSQLQDMLTDAAEVSVRSGRSASSLQLTLENQAVHSRAGLYVDAITSEVERYDNVTGFAFAINGRINSADLYHSPVLFAKLWPKLIEAAAIEAISKSSDVENDNSLTVADLITWLNETDNADATSQSVNDATRLLIKQRDSDVCFETIDSERGTVVHKNVIRK